jgi:hypothetical protein
MFRFRLKNYVVFAGLALLLLGVGLVGFEVFSEADGSSQQAADAYVIVAWNDLGMHCYNPQFQDLAVLPPWNTLWAQVIRLGDPPQIVTTGVRVTYEFPDNTYSVGKSDFWDMSPYAGVQNAQWLFNLTEPLPPNVGLTGKGLSGEMDLHGDHFVAEGIPLTEYRDSAPTIRYPYQLATVIAWDTTSGAELARLTVVAPVSTEMHCETCHYDGALEGIATGRVDTNILTLHDMENMEEEEGGYDVPLMDRRPVLCAECHASNALNAPGVQGVPNFSKAMHEKHQERVTQDQAGCYSCHPGPQTKCLRDTMSQQGMDCIDCHGNMAAVAQNPTPWLNEPRCDNEVCHGSAYQQDHPLYRMSKEHGGIYCEACHDSTHAIAPSREANDAIKFVALQGRNGTLEQCTVCHATMPAGPGPHGMAAPTLQSFSWGPDRSGTASPGDQAVYGHTLRNTGNVSDTYDLTWNSSQGWVEVAVAVESGTVVPPVSLSPGQTATVTATVTVPTSEIVRGLVDRTVITVTSMVSPTLTQMVTDKTLVPQVQVYLPLLLK